MKSKRISSAVVLLVLVLMCGHGMEAQTAMGPGGGGSMYAPVVSPYDASVSPKVMFVACDMTGLYRSADNGQSWTLLDQHKVHGSTRFSVVFDPGKAGHVLGFQPIYCSDATCSNACASGGPNCNQGLMESNDNGLTWTTYPTALPRSYPGSTTPVQVTAAAFTADLGLVIGTTKGIYMMQSNTWILGSDHLAVPNDPTSVVNDMDVINFVTVKDPTTQKLHHFAATVTDIFHWNDLTSHWDAFGPATPTRPIGFYITTDTTLPSSRIRGFAGGANGSHYVLYVSILTDSTDITSAGGVYRYDSSTAAWTRQVPGLNLGQTNNTTLSAAVSPSNTPVTVTVGSSAAGVAGNLAVMDSTNAAQQETDVITAVPSSNAITLYKVFNSHNASAAVQITGIEADCAFLSVPRYDRLAVADADPDTAYVTVVNTTCSPDVYKGTFNASLGQMIWKPVYDGFQSHDGTFRPATNLAGGWIEIEPSRALTTPWGGLGWGFGGAAHGFTVDPQSSSTAVFANNAAVHVSTNGAGQTPPATRDWVQSYTQLRSATGTGGTSSARWRSNGLNVTTAWNYVIHPDKPSIHFILSTDIGLARRDTSETATGDAWLPISQVVNNNVSPARLDQWENFYALAFELPSLVPTGATPRIWAAVSDHHDIPHDTQLDDNQQTLGHGAVIYSEDDGVTWKTPLNSGLPAGPVVSVVYKAGVLYASVWATRPSSTTGIYQSSDRGDHWTAVGDLVTNTNTSSRHFYRLQFDNPDRATASGTLYIVVAATKNTFLPGGLYKFNGTQWQAAGSNLSTLGNIAPMDYAFDPATGAIYMTVAAVQGSNGGGVYRLNPANNTWGLLNIPFPGGYHDTVVAFAPFVKDSTAYITTITHGLWSMSTSDDGTHATEVTAIPFLGPQRLTFDAANNGQVYISTLGAGVFKANLLGVSASPASQTVAQGSSGTYTVSVNAPGGSTTSLSVSGLPAGATPTFTPSSLTGTASSSLSISTSSTTPTGSYTLTITGTNGSMTQTTIVTLNVVTPFAVTATPASQTVAQGSSTSYTVNVTAPAGSTTGLSVSGLPAGATPTFTPSSLTGSASSTLNIATTSTTATGAYMLTITGSNGSTTQSATVTLNIVTPFTITTTPASQTISQGNGTSYTVNVTAPAGSTTSLSVSGLPTGATPTFTPSSLTGSGSSALNIATTSTTATGSYTLTITATNGTATQSATVTLNVVAPFTVNATPASQTVAQGSSTSYTVSVTAPAGSTSSLSVSGLPAGATPTFTPSSLTGSGSATLNIATTSTTATGTYTLTITGTNGSTTQSATVTLNIVTPFTITATPATQTISQGNSTSYTVNVTAPAGSTTSLSVSGLPTGATPTFTPSSLTGSGSSALNIATSSTTPTGSYTLTITATNGSSTQSTSVSLVITDFTIAVTPASQTIVASASTSYTVSTSALNGFGGAVTLSVSGLPAGVTGTFTPVSITGAGTSTLNISSSGSAAAGNYTLTITGANGNDTRNATATLVIQSFSVSATPASQSVTAGGSTSYTATVSALNGFSGAVTLSVTGLPAGATSNFAPASVNGSGSSTLSVTTAGSTPSGSYTLTITGTSGSLTRSTTVILTVGTNQDFTISATPPSQSMNDSCGSASYTATVAAVNGFSGAVTLDVSGQPSNATTTISPNPINGSGSAIIGFTTPGGAPPIGPALALDIFSTSIINPSTDYTVTITGTSGNLVHSTTVVLTVVSGPQCQ